VTTALANAVAMLARERSWQGTARESALNCRSVATIVKRAVQYGLDNRARPPVPVIGIDEVSRRKGQFTSRWSTIWSGGSGCGSERIGPKRR
jgi:hypothetical protein